MRAFSDDRGRTWDVVVGRESWGALFAIFVPRSGAGTEEAPEIRQAPLGASGYDEANAALDAMSDEGLRELLGRSDPKKNTA